MKSGIVVNVVDAINSGRVKEVNIVFPHQLFENNPLVAGHREFYLVEEFLFFRQYQFHKQKIALHRASMQFYRDYLESKGCSVHYIESADDLADIRSLVGWLADCNIDRLHVVDTVDDWLGTRLNTSAAELGIEVCVYDTPMFLNNREQLGAYFKSGRKKFFQTEFYKRERRRLNILMEEDGQPRGGKWTYDADNRLKYPRDKVPPGIAWPDQNAYHRESREYVEKYFADYPGELSERTMYPVDFKGARKWLKEFIRSRFKEFGPYEDSLVAGEHILHHSVLTPMLNVGLLTPEFVLHEILNAADSMDIPINSTEGFVRQVIGWREFIRGVYVARGREERTKNFWGFTRKVPKAFYSGSTGIDPVDITIRKVLKTGYCHHIERLMVLANFMLLCEFDPDEVYRWFMELFVDSYDWVMVPNVYGMSQFADGGIMSTKPYISGSNYLRKMSDYKPGSWNDIWDALFWRFMHVHREFFLSNPRMSMLIRTFDKWDEKKRSDLLEHAEKYLQQLDNNRP